jgi:hypothetical protein
MKAIAILTVFTFLVGMFGLMQAYGANSVTVKGEVIDTYCFSTMGARGASHRQCGIDCAKKGIPVGILEEGTEKVYVLLPDKDKGTLPEGLIEKMGSVVSVTGMVYSTGGSQFLTVESFK